MPCQTSSTASTSSPKACGQRDLGEPRRNADPQARRWRASARRSGRWRRDGRASRRARPAPRPGPARRAARPRSTSRSVPSSRSAGWSLRLRPEQGHRLGHVADIVAAHVEQDRIDPLLGDRADRGGLHRRQVELAGQRRQRIAAVGIGRAPADSRRSASAWRCASGCRRARRGAGRSRAWPGFSFAKRRATQGP